MRVRVLFVTALLLLTLCTGPSSSSASVTINGTALDQIDDIIEFTTGSHVDEKFSLLKSYSRAMQISGRTSQTAQINQINQINQN